MANTENLGSGSPEHKGPQIIVIQTSPNGDSRSLEVVYTNENGVPWLCWENGIYVNPDGTPLSLMSLSALAEIGAIGE